MTVATLSAPRAQSIVQRAYVYIVALVAIHMAVLGVANVVRVLAEIALGAPSGGFTGLPFLFNDFSRPRELYREQASLGIALLAVGAPVWWWAFGSAQHAARDPGERASWVRSGYVHIVVFVTALLVFGYGQRALRLVLQGATFGDPATGPTYGLEPQWQAGAAGAAAMAVAAAIALAFHVRVSMADRRAVPDAAAAATVRHLLLYALVVIGLFWAAFTTANTLGEIWTRVVESMTGLPQKAVPPTPPPGAPPHPPIPSQDEFLRFRLLGAIPAMLGGYALWLGTWIPLQRGVERGPDTGIERRGIIRKLAIYLVVFVSAIAVLFAATAVLSEIGRRLLGDPIVEAYTTLWHEIGPPLVTVVVFGALWVFYRGVVEGEAARETEAGRAATLRRLYTYLISAMGLAMAAFGAAGVVGAIGSGLFGLNEHSHREVAAYAALVVVGGAAWWFHIRRATARLDDAERRSLPRRLYLYLAVLGGVIGLLVFGSAALYRLLNAALALELTRETVHDLWHFAVDGAVSAAVAWRHFRGLRADRSALGASAEETYAVTVLVRAADRDAAKARVRAALADSPDVTLKP